MSQTMSSIHAHNKTLHLPTVLTWIVRVLVAAIFIMAGAVATHLFIIGGSYALPLALLLTSTLELYLSRRQIRKAIKKVRSPKRYEYLE